MDRELTIEEMERLRIGGYFPLGFNKFYGPDFQSLCLIYAEDAIELKVNDDLDFDELVEGSALCFNILLQDYSDDLVEVIQTKMKMKRFNISDYDDDQNLSIGTFSEKHLVALCQFCNADLFPFYKKYLQNTVLGVVEKVDKEHHKVFIALAFYHDVALNPYFGK